MTKVGIYGGAFDPIHHGHLILAREALESLGLEKIIFVPAAASPFKPAPFAPGEMRLKMLNAAIANQPGFAVDDCELHRAPPSYTIDTVQQIRKRETGPELYLLIGQDNVTTLNQWRQFDELKKLVHFVVLDRTGSDMQPGHDVVRRKIDISGTEIRARVASGRPVSYLVPAAVEEIIRKNNLYRETGK